MLHAYLQYDNGNNEANDKWTGRNLVRQRVKTALNATQNQQNNHSTDCHVTYHHHSSTYSVVTHTSVMYLLLFLLNVNLLLLLIIFIILQ